MLSLCRLGFDRFWDKHKYHNVFHVTKYRKDRKYLTIQQLTENLWKLLVPPPKVTLSLQLTHMSLTEAVLYFVTQKGSVEVVEHLFYDENDSTAWWKGTVLSMHCRWLYRRKCDVQCNIWWWRWWNSAISSLGRPQMETLNLFEPHIIVSIYGYSLSLPAHLQCSTCSTIIQEFWGQCEHYKI